MKRSREADSTTRKRSRASTSRAAKIILAPGHSLSLRTNHEGLESGLVRIACNVYRLDGLRALETSKPCFIYASEKNYYRICGSIGKDEVEVESFVTPVNTARRISLEIFPDPPRKSVRYLDRNELIHALREIPEGTVLNVGQVFTLDRIGCGGVVIGFDSNTVLGERYMQVGRRTSYQFVSETQDLVLYDGISSAKRINIQICSLQSVQERCPGPYLYSGMSLLEAGKLNASLVDLLNEPFPLDKTIVEEIELYPTKGSVKKDKYIVALRVSLPGGSVQSMLPATEPHILSLYQLDQRVKTHIDYDPSKNIYLGDRTIELESAVIEIEVPSLHSDVFQATIDIPGLETEIKNAHLEMVLRGDTGCLNAIQEAVVYYGSLATYHLRLIEAYPCLSRSIYRIGEQTRLEFRLHSNSTHQVLLSTASPRKCQKVFFDSSEPCEGKITEEQIRAALGTTVIVGGRYLVGIPGIVLTARKVVFQRNREYASKHLTLVRTPGTVCSATVIVVDEDIDEPSNPPPISNPVEKMTQLLRSSIGGCQEHLDVIVQEVLMPRSIMADEFRLRGLRPSRGIILHGPPGTGKSSLARKVAESLGILPENTIQVVATKMYDKYVGQTEKKISGLFQRAKDDWIRLGDRAPLHAVILDEIDGLLGESTSRQSSSDRKAVTHFLSEMDGLERFDNIICVGTTNQIEALSPAVLRPGRFDLKLAFRLPDRTGRLEILEIYTKRLREIGRLEDFDLGKIADRTEGLSGADLEKLVTSASMLSLKRMAANQVVSMVTEADFQSCLDEIRGKNQGSQSHLRMYV